MSIIKDYNIDDDIAGVKYKVAFWHAQWAFCGDQCISTLFFFITVL